MSTTVETSDPASELAAGLQLLGKVDEKFVEVVDVYEPLESGQRYGGGGAVLLLLGGGCTAAREQ